MNVPPPIRRLRVMLECDDSLVRRVRYVFDTLFLAAGIGVEYVEAPPTSGLWLHYGPSRPIRNAASLCVSMVHAPSAWIAFAMLTDCHKASVIEGVAVLFRDGEDPAADVRFDLAANAFYFLSSWGERSGSAAVCSRQLYATSTTAQRAMPQDVVDRYLRMLVDKLNARSPRLWEAMATAPSWPVDATYAVVLSHDVDFLPVEPLDNTVQLLKTMARHLVRHGDVRDAWLALRGFLTAVTRGRDPYGCVPEIIERERLIGVRSSFQVAVGHRHPNDVNYCIEDDRVRDYLRAITDAGFDLCLHGSVRATEQRAWYVAEAELLAERLAPPVGSRQHFLSFNYDALFTAQEEAGIRYDMSMGYPDHPGPRSAFSYPYFPYNLHDDRPYDVVQIPLILMDVTLSGYMGLRAEAARPVVDTTLADLCSKRGCGSVVWHPIVFGAARDPGYDELYWHLIRRTRATGGLATDGRTIDAFWRSRARGYASFAHCS